MFLEDLDEEDYEIAIKVVVVGNGAVGKSSLIQRYCKGIFTKSYKKTIGVDFLEKHITASGEDVRLMLWDTAGQEEFDAITKAYYRGAQACVVVFSTTDRASFEAVKKWKRKVEDECGHIPMVLVQNKIDLLHESQVDSHEIEKFARNTGLKLFRTSVKENLNVGKVFHYLSERHIEAVSRWSDDIVDDSDENNIIHIGQETLSSPLPHRDVRVRFSSSTENIESHSNSSTGSNSSGSNNITQQGLSYFHTKLLSSQRKKKNKNKKPHPHAHHHHPHHYPQPPHHHLQHPHHYYHQIHHHPHQSWYPGNYDSPNNKTIVLNPFARSRRRQQQQQQQQQLFIHASDLSPQPAASSNKPACRVI